MRARLLWYRPDTFERGVVDEGQYGVGLITADVDGDGELEIVCSRLIPEPWNWQLVFYKRQGDSWTRGLIEEANDGGAHDLLFIDIDGDGEKELVANAAYCKVPGLYIHKRSGDTWQRHIVSEHIFAEGLAAADLDGDGRLELIHGPDYYSAPEAGVYQRPLAAHDLRAESPRDVPRHHPGRFRGRTPRHLHHRFGVPGRQAELV